MAPILQRNGLDSPRDAETMILERSVLGSFLSLSVHFFPVTYFLN